MNFSFYCFKFFFDKTRLVQQKNGINKMFFVDKNKL